MKLGQAMYEAAQAAEGAGAEGGEQASSSKDDVVDADYEEIDDNKKSS